MESSNKSIEIVPENRRNAAVRLTDNIQENDNMNEEKYKTIIFIPSSFIHKRQEVSEEKYQAFIHHPSSFIKKRQQVR